MDERTRIADQLRRALEGEAWHGPSVLELLEGIGASDASARPVPGAHSIRELVLHLASTYRLVLRRVHGDGSPLSAEEDWPSLSMPVATDEQWQDDVGALRALNSEMRSAVLGFPPDRLDQPLVATPPYSAWVQFVGLTQHDLYHAGQIAVLKRALAPPAQTKDS